MMDSLGVLDTNWVSGYDGGQLHFISKDVFCYKCGVNVKFVNGKDEESVLASPGEGISAIAAHSVNKVVAIADRSIPPKIYVLSYPEFERKAILEDGAQLEFVSLAFSTSDYLAALSGIPDYTLTIWRYTDGTKMCSASIQPSIPSSFGFNPANWRQLCITTAKDIVLWTIEQSDQTFVVQDQKVLCPALDGILDAEPADRDLPTRASTHMSRKTVDVPRTSIAGVKGEEADEFLSYEDKRERTSPTSHCWTPAGDVLVGCAGGQLLRVDGETFLARILYNPGPFAYSSLSKESMILDGNITNMSAEPSQTNIYTSASQESQLQFGESSILSIALHKEGVFLGGEDGVLRHIEIMGSNKLRLKASYTLEHPISCLAFNPPHHALAAGGRNGTVEIMSMEDGEREMSILREDHAGKFVAIDMLCGGIDNDQVVSLREDGEVQVWSAEDGLLRGTMPLGIQGVSMASSPMMHAVFIGTSSGFLYVVDCTKVDQMRIVKRMRVHKGPIKILQFSQNGKLLLTASDDGNVFVVDGRASKKNEPLGYVDVPGDVEGLSMLEEGGLYKVVVTSNTSGQAGAGANSMVYFELPFNVVDHARSLYASLKCDFLADQLNLMRVRLGTAVHGIQLMNDGIFYALSHQSKRLVKFVLPESGAKKDVESLEVNDEFSAHELAGGSLSASPHKKWMATCGADGRITIRIPASADRMVNISAHDHSSGGSRFCVFSPDGTKLFTSGYDDVISCFKWSWTAAGQAEAQSALEASRKLRTSLLGEQKAEDVALEGQEDWSPAVPAGASRPGSGVEKAEKEETEKEQAIEQAMQEDAIYSTPTPTPAADATWLDMRNIEAVKYEDQAYTDLKTDLRSEIRDIRRQLQNMMTDNEGMDNMERLEHYEFDLDVEEQARLHAEGEAEVQRLRSEKENENLAKQYLADLIKQECWDNMVVKGRGITAFTTSHECHNYPMKARSKAELNKLEAVKGQRQVEIEELAARKEFADITKSTNPQDEDVDGDEDPDSKEQPSTTGSLGAQYGGDSELYYSQFELNMREQKANQIVLLEDAIYRIRMSFNQEFDQVYKKKESEIVKIIERNKRIRKILIDLDMVQEVLDPSLGVIEKPEMLLVVTDEEVKVEKFLTAAQRREAEEEKKREDERMAREHGDNWRERGLNMMMGGVLEIKKEDELKKDIPMPAFMTDKKEADWSEDEKKLAQDYERRVKELEDERDKYRKQLEQELRKLQTQILESTQSFDEALQRLFNRKIKTEMVVYQEELKMLRLKYSLLQEEELNHRQEELNHLLEFKQNMKTLNNQAVVEARKHMDAFREQYDILVAEDKVMDKAFKREFHDVPGHYVDLLHKLFRRRPRGQKVRNTAETPVYDPSSGNPFSERPSTARQTTLAATALESALAELDRESNMPEGLDTSVWERMCVYRHQKIESEQLVKQKALVLADMQAFYQKRTEESEELKMELDDIVNSISRLKEDCMRFLCNLEVQLLMKQGQVEVDSGPFIQSYTESILIHRTTVEELNGKIRQFGETKIASMMESKDFRKSIVQLEWEHKKMTMETEDLHNKMRDIQNLKVTREIQAFLNEEDYDSKKSQEIATLEQTLLVQKQHHEKNVADKKRQVKELKRVMKERGEENSGLGNQLEDLNVTVNERKHINEVNADKNSDAGREKRYREIVQRRQFVELAKAQAQEVAVLRAEVERLRMRTFPALVQVEH